MMETINKKTLPRKEAPTANKITVFSALISYALAYIYVSFVFFEDIGRAGLAVFTALFCALVEALFAVLKKKPTRESTFWLCCILVVAASSALYHNHTVMVWSLLLLHCMAAYYLLCRAGLLISGQSGQYAPLDALSAGIIVPFTDFFLRPRTLFSALKQRARGTTDKRKLTATLLTVSASLALLVLAASILSRADSMFSQSVGRWFALNIDLGDFPVRLLLSIPVGYYIYGLVCGASQREKSPIDKARLDGTMTRLRAVPSGVCAAALTAFLLLYSLFFAFQISYLVGALGGSLPVGFTFSEYAVQGFSEMCEMMALDFLLLFAAAKLSTKPLRDSKLLKTLSLLLCLCGTLFAAVAATKLALYVQTFGFTQRRVLSGWFCAVLFILTVMAAVSIIKPFKVFKAGIITAAALFAALCICDPDARIVDANLYLYKSKVTQQLDVSYIGYECGANEKPAKLVSRLYDAGWFDGGRTVSELTDALGAAQIERSGDDYVFSWGENGDKYRFSVTSAYDAPDRVVIGDSDILEG